jgi:hypothetical protein
LNYFVLPLPAHNSTSICSEEEEEALQQADLQAAAEALMLEEVVEEGKSRATMQKQNTAELLLPHLAVLSLDCIVV